MNWQFWRIPIWRRRALDMFMITFLGAALISIVVLAIMAFSPNY
jgi:hypothetical protein